MHPEWPGDPHNVCAYLYLCVGGRLECPRGILGKLGPNASWLTAEFRNHVLGRGPLPLVNDSAVDEENQVVV